MFPGSGILHFVQNDGPTERPAAAHGKTTLRYFQAATSLNWPQLAICFVRYAGSFSVSDTARSICRHCRQSHAALIIARCCFICAPERQSIARVQLAPDQLSAPTKPIVAESAKSAQAASGSRSAKNLRLVTWITIAPFCHRSSTEHYPERARSHSPVR